MARRNNLNKQREKLNLTEKLINMVMKDGKKSIASGIVKKVLLLIEKTSKKEGEAILERAVKNVMPAVQVKSKRIGGATFQVPSEVPLERSETLALKWILLSATSRSEKGIVAQLHAELIDASGVSDDSEGKEGRGKGGAVRKKDDTHKMAEANKAYVHYRW